MKKLLAICPLLGLITLLAAGCGGASTATSSTSANSSGITEIHLLASDFAQNHATLHKGDHLRLMDDVAGIHIVLNGTWDGTIIKAGAEAGAPLVNHQFNGHDTYLIGPFATSGVYQLYCSVHLGMNLTVTVI